MIFNETNIEVRYLDVDSMKVVNNVKYFEYFEIARLDTFNKFFFPFKDLESKLNFYIPVIESHAKYLKFAEFQDILNVQTFIKQKPEWRLQFNYEIRCNDQLICFGFSKHAFMYGGEKKSTNPPIELVKIFDKYF